MFGFVKSVVSIDPIAATASIGSGDNGTITIEVEEPGSDGNNYTVEVIDNSGTPDVDLNANLSNYDLTVDLATDSSGNLDASVNTASNIAAEIGVLAEFVTYYSGDGTGVFNEAEGPYNFKEGEGPEEKCVFVKEEEEGSILYRDVYYEKVYRKNVYDVGTTKLYFEISIPVGSFSDVGDYRQVGLYRNLEREEGVPSDQEILELEDVSDNGELYALSNITRVVRQSDRYEKISLIIDF